MAPPRDGYDTRPHILVVGAGNIGRRHLQALLTSDLELEVTVVETAAAARAETSSLLTELGVEPTAFAFAALDDLPPSIDVAIVATAADARSTVLDRLLAHVEVPHVLLEKFLFQSPGEYDKARGSLQRGGAAAWVNTPRRIWPAYGELRERIGGKSPVRIDVTVPAHIGIGSNSIHFLDLLAFLSGCNEFALNGHGLDPAVIPAKRPGAVEFTGTLSGRGSDDSEFRYRTSGSDRILVEVGWADRRVVVDETNDGVAVLQSRLTDRVVSSLLATGDCGLTSYAESSKLHLAILQPLLDHYRRAADATADRCPIT